MCPFNMILRIIVFNVAFYGLIIYIIVLNSFVTDKFYNLLIISSAFLVTSFWLFAVTGFHLLYNLKNVFSFITEKEYISILRFHNAL